jgi:hypothetical protein
MAGMRSWTSAQSAFRVVVMMEQVSTIFPSGFLHCSQIPANAKIDSSAMATQNGIFVFPFFTHW